MPRAKTAASIPGVSAEIAPFELPEEGRALFNALTHAQRIWVVHHINGENPSAAYMKSHPGCAPTTAYSEGWRYRRNPKVVAFLDYHDIHQLEGAFMSRQEKRRIAQQLTYTTVDDIVDRHTGEYLRPELAHLIDEVTTQMDRDGNIIGVRAKKTTVREALAIDDAAAAKLALSSGAELTNGDVSGYATSPSFIEAMYSNAEFRVAFLAYHEEHGGEIVVRGEVMES